MNNWIKGLKEYNKGSDSWCIPKKGSKVYNQIMNKQKSQKLDIDEYNNMARELGRQEMKKRGIYKKNIFD
jgi:hypothetical protein